MALEYVKIKDIVLRSIAKGSWKCLALLLKSYNHDAKQLADVASDHDHLENL